jgi:hypothetical protein
MGETDLVSKYLQKLQEYASRRVVYQSRTGRKDSYDAGILNVRSCSLESTPNVGTGGDEGYSAAGGVALQVGGEGLHFAVSAVVVARHNDDFAPS